MRLLLTWTLLLRAVTAAAVPSSPTASSLAVVSEQVLAAQPVATVDIGVLRGVQTSLPSANAAVNKFLGVPFAEKPERFSPPVRKGKLSGPLQVTAWKPACMQQLGPGPSTSSFLQGIFNQPPPQESEDCLYLNVYAPSTPAPAGGRAVMFWLFGGALQFGHAGQPLYDGSAFAAYQDVIIVAPNYRTNVFGFPTSPELPLAKRNLGFMDQRLALQWVQTNIRAFGGDPKKVTIFGESAGASSVDTLITSYTTANAPFRAAILESGEQTVHAQNYTNNPAVWTGLLQALGCQRGSTELACVRKVPAGRIKAAIEASASQFQPAYDGITLVASPKAARAAGRFAKVPVLVGSNSQEGRVFVVSNTSETDFLQTYFGGVASLIPRISSAYSNRQFPSNYARNSQIFTDFGFLCPEYLMAKNSMNSGAPTWLYQYNASFPNSAFTNPFGPSGAYHSSEIGVVFQSYAGGPINRLSADPLGLLQTQKPATKQQMALSKFVNAAWARFAKNPAAGPGWPALQAGADGKMGIIGDGSKGGVGVAAVKQQALHAVCPMFMPLYKSYAS